MDMRRLGARISEYRGAGDNSLGEIAEKAKIAKSYLAKIERGEVENPGLRTLISIANALETTVTDLIKPIAAKDNDGEHGQREFRKEMLELLQQDMPPSLLAFIKDQAIAGKPIPVNLQQSLALVHLRGKKPSRKEDWSYLYETLRRAIRSSKAP